MNKGERAIIKFAVYQLVATIERMKVSEARERVRLASSEQITTLDGFDEAIAAIYRECSEEAKPC